MSDPFCDAKLKIARANKHIADLNTEIGAFIDRKPYIIVPDTKSQPPSHGLFLSIRERAPKSFPLIIGDAVHNLRSALDILATTLVDLNGGNTKNVFFPFGIDSNGFEDMLKKRHIDRAGENVIKIIRSLQPYKGGNDDLRGIHDLDISDKHRGIIPTSQPIRLLRTINGEYFELMFDHFARLEDGMCLATDATCRPDDPKFSDYFELDFEITFAQGQPFESMSVLNTLEKLSKVTDGVVQRFERLFP